MQPQKRPERRITGPAGIFTIAPILCLLALAGCDLFNATLDDNWLANIDAEIAWANAPEAPLRIEFPPAWGASSPPMGALTGHRVGFPFSVEFTPSEVHFHEWRAYGADNQRLDTGEAPTVAIIREEGGRATITVNTAEQVRLVPHSLERPRLGPRTNPPLIFVPSPFPFEQQINLWFNSEIDQSTVVMYESGSAQGGNDGHTVRISAIHTAGTSRGQPFQGHGDVTGYFAVNFPSGYRITLRPSNAPGFPASDLAHLTISVTVGPGIQNAAGASMAQAETVSFMTDASAVQRVYAPGTVSASRDGASGTFFDDGMQWNNPLVDRRLNPDNPALSAVYVRINGFEPPEGEAPPLPNRITIVERLSHSPTGFPLPGSTQSHTYRADEFDVTGNVWTIRRELMTRQAGIVQIVALPWYYCNAGDATIAPQNLAGAIAAGAFVTVAVDNEPPAPPIHGASLSGHSSVDGGVHVYGVNTTISLTLGGAAQMSDNAGSGGILPASAWASPWTMDGTEHLEWEARFGTGAGAVASGWRSAGGSDQWNFAGALALNTNHYVYVRARDRMGNESDWARVPGLRLRRTDATLSRVSNLRAQVNDAGDSINLGWTPPTGTYHFKEVVIRRHRSTPIGDQFENEVRQRLDGSVSEHVFAVSTISTARVRDGNPVTGVLGYEISVITHNAVGPGTTGPIWVYNIPGMITQGTGTGTGSNTVRITTGNLSGLTATNSAGRNFVLTRDFDLTGNWTPVGTGTGAAAFQGNFFGNGRTVTINGIAPGPALGRGGLFGVAHNALIRDLTVVYANMTVAGTTGTNNVGGIAGNATGTTRILNSIARGATLAVTTGGTTRLGGIVGNMENTASIQNSLAALNVTLNAGGAHALTVGGVVGRAVGTATDTVTLDDITATGTVSMSKSSGGGINILGGIAGQMSHAYLRNGAFAGRINIPWFDSTAVSRIGGLVGDFTVRGLLYGGTATGNISVSSSGTGAFHLGGVLGSVQGGTRVDVQNSVYSDGAIYFRAGAGATQNIGGFVGSVQGNSEITYSHSRALRITAELGGTGSLRVGGFAGLLERAVVSNSSSASPVIVPHFHRSTGAAQVGGFAGRMAFANNIPSRLTDVFSTGSVYVHSRCTTGGGGIGGLVGFLEGGAGTITDLHTIYRSRATGSVTVTVHHDALIENPGIAAGGLVGRAQATRITQSFATGNVTARRVSYPGGTGWVSAGGLVGFLGHTATGNNAQRSSIDNSYALGNVIAHNSWGGNPGIFAGGLVGRMQVAAAYGIDSTFAASSVSARNGAMGATELTIAGGLVGHRQSGHIRHNAAVGPSVTAQGGAASRRAARIFGFPTTTTTPSFASFNYALATMDIEEVPGYMDFTFPPPEPQTPTARAPTARASRQTPFGGSSSGTSRAFTSRNGTSAAFRAASRVWRGSKRGSLAPAAAPRAPANDAAGRNGANAGDSAFRAAAFPRDPGLTAAQRGFFTPGTRGHPGPRTR